MKKNKFKQIYDIILKSTVYDVVDISPLSKLDKFSTLYKNSVHLKREDLHCVHSFKIRGAYQKISQLSDHDKSLGIIAASAGNHAQGVAYSAYKLGIKSTIVMPKTTPQIKVEAVKSYGSHVVLYGDSYDESYEYAMSLAKKSSYVFIHPYDDINVIAGQGTIAKEIDSQLSSIDYIFVPVGGGGLISGIVSYFKYIKPEIKIISVEPENSACFYEAMKHNDRVVLDHVGIFADGVAVKQIGELPFELINAYVDDSVLVTTDEICASIKDIYDNTRAIAEPSGGLSLAGIKKYVLKHNLQNKTCVGILCGANINFHRLRHISERAELGENRESLFAISIPEVKGSFLEFCKLLKGRSITEFNYRYVSSEKATIFCGVEMNETEQSQDVERYYNKCGYNAVNLSNNEMAKLHIRYMVGGKVESISNERLFRFQFPERPGALLEFLSTLGSEYNISLFHYRNHGAAYGRILIGVQVNEDDYLSFKRLIDTIGYVYFEETDNPAYKLFL